MDSGTGGFASSLRRKGYGVAFIIIVISLIGLTVGIYNKSLWFQDSVPVTLEAKAAGNQLNLGGDVKIRGVNVGDIRTIKVDGDIAKIGLAISPGRAADIPANVTARILPKTLFGEKYVQLVVPAAPVGHIQAGDVITQDRSRTAIETGKVFQDLLPLLHTLHPVQLNMTLNALATALEGRGNKLGDNTVLAERYLDAFNPHLATLNHDIRGLAALGDSLDAAAPELLRFLHNTGASLQNVVAPRPDQLEKFFTGTKGFADTTRQFLEANESNLIALNDNSVPVLNVLQKYSVEFPCLLRGLTDIQPRLEGTFATGPYLYVHLEVINRMGASYVPGADKPTYNDYGPPSCAGLPQPGVKFSYPHPGVKKSTVLANEAALSTPAYGDIGPIGSKGEAGVVGSVAGALLGKGGAQVPDYATLLLGPLLRGSAVSLR